jgi:Threonine dehydrogenase and related Zn-dependent dehydrogenases
VTVQRAVVASGDGGVEVAEVEFAGLRVPPLPGVLRHGEALPHGAVVRVLATGICGSDLHTLADPRTAAGQVCGHEAAGVVAEVGGDVETVRVGDAVVVPFNVACGHCRSCLDGHTAHCGTTNPHRPGATYGMGPRLGGWMGMQAEYALVPYADANLYRPYDQDWALDHVTDLVLLADLLPTGYHAASQTGATGGDSVYVAGAGPVGLATAMCLRLLGVDRVVIGDPREERQRKAADLGFAVIDTRSEDLAAALHEAIGEPEVSATVDCVGLAADGLLDQLISVTRTNGTVVSHRCLSLTHRG